MTLPDDPWRDISRPTLPHEINARRVDAGGPWGFFWALDHEGRRLLILQHEPFSFVPVKLPSFKGFDVLQTNASATEAALSFRLLDDQLREPFIRLCLDIMDASNRRATENEALAVAVARTWRWHHLLRGGSGRLGVEQQKGLLAELLTLRDLVAPRTGILGALQAWVGPLGAVHDFRLPHASIECKAVRGSSEPFVAISSEYQLDPPARGPLYLRVVELQQSEAGTRGSFTLSDVVDDVVAQAAPLGQPVIDLVAARLEAAGIRPGDTYCEDHWSQGPVLTVHVDSDFPRLVPQSLPAGISGVRYALSVAPARPYAIDEAVIWPSTSEETNKWT
ncbi:MAG: PD-(D/E)XK motif protein [Beijerinckiaceae bacterium]|nr:PD-(D/E)XK motif protein [Beijerinckiaceae bacterium]